MKQEKRMAIYSAFCENHSVLFATDVAARGLDFNKAVDWVVQTRLLKKKKLKINVHRPLGNRVVFDDEGNTLPPLARIAGTQSG
ncbi:DEAD-box ATP-dependent RNA helicase 32-like [Vicia villosa]|uniref:DEAD-box ATP-dependent RNA helicase 32-like n=1 Tax=Vicia villosa TaxID=3911 RepID=UPI00273AF157|nr:DEAD-box ATP-dependent RNA helicase 32-like [Vicia villosa]XP_058760749.1 DEAD-box ATP-dependent RNA helicase 32-like [Vicia villosa]